MNGMRVLVTGAEGFVGGYLVPHLLQHGAEVIPTSFQATSSPHFPLPLHPLDIRDAGAVEALFSAASPTHIVHLAAISSVAQSFHNPQATDDINVHGTRVLLEAAQRLSVPPRMLLIGSADEYGPNDGTPLSEWPLNNLHPVSPYATSKLAIEKLVEEEPAFRAMTIRTRSFPHIGPRQRGSFFIPEVTEQILRIEHGESPPILRVGNLDAVRDFLDVRDVVNAYGLLLEKGVAGDVYNVGSGNGIRMSDLLHTLLSFSSVSITIEKDPAKVRPIDIPILLSDSTKLRNATEWQPTHVLSETLKEILETARSEKRL